MAETIRLGDIAIAVTRKDIKNVHLSVHPPMGRVTLVAPTGTRLEVARAYAVTKLHWIRDQQAKLIGQARETPRQFVERESHYLWGSTASAIRRLSRCQAVGFSRPQTHHSHVTAWQRLCQTRRDHS